MDPQPQASPSKKSVYLSAQKVSIVAVVAFLFLIFGAIVVFANKYGDGSPMPSPSGQPDGLFQAGEPGAFQAKPPAQKQVQGAQDQAANYTVPQPEKSPSPTPKPSKTPKPSESAAPTTAPTSNPTPTPSPTNAPETTPAPSPLIVSCSAEPSEVAKDASIEWKATASGGNNSFSYSWSGDDGLSGSSEKVTKTYSSAGLKKASVKITSNGNEVTSSCQVTVKES